MASNLAKRFSDALRGMARGDIDLSRFVGAIVVVGNDYPCQVPNGTNVFTEREFAQTVQGAPLASDKIQ